MIFKYIRTSEILSGDEKEIEINTLEELIEFQKKSCSSIILSDNLPTIIIQKPTDKVEPKFKQGDIIKEKETGNIFYVNSIEDFGYTLHYKNCTTKGCTLSFKYEDNYELVEQTI